MESKTGRRREVSWDGSMYNKYKIEHTDGTPLKGKKYFVLRLDSDDPIEAARVARAMRAYEGKIRNCDVGTAKEQWKRFDEFCIDWEESGPNGWCSDECPCMAIKSKESDGCFGQSGCFFIWSQMPYEEERKGDGDGR